MFYTKAAEKIKNTHFMFNDFFFFFKNRAVYEMTWKNIVESHSPQTKINTALRTACWIPKATQTLSQYAIHIAFPLQQWLIERA